MPFPRFFRLSVWRVIIFSRTKNLLYTRKIILFKRKRYNFQWFGHSSLRKQNPAYCRRINTPRSAATKKSPARQPCDVTERYPGGVAATTSQTRIGCRPCRQKNARPITAVTLPSGTQEELRLQPAKHALAVGPADEMTLDYLLLAIETIFV